MTRSTFALIALLVAAPAFAQTPAAAPRPQAQPAGDAQLRLIVVDQTSAGIPTASITLTPPTGEPVVVMTDERGVATVPAIASGTVKVHIEFSGFETLEGTMNLRRGANNQTLTMRLAGLTDEVVVTNEQVGGDTRGSAMVTELTKAEIEDLPDTAEDLQAYLEELAGPGGATFFLNGFRGGRLPTKDEIRSIRIRTNSFSADGHESGGRGGIEIITRPAMQSFNGQAQLRYQGDVLNARHAQSQTETPEGTRQVEVGFRGPIVNGKTSFSLNVSGRNSYEANTSLARDLSGNLLSSQATQVRVPNDQKGFNAGIEHALTANSTLRLTYQRNQSEGRNQGLGQYDLPERASERNSTGNLLRGQVQGIVGSSMLNEFRVQFNRNENDSISVSGAPTTIIQDTIGFGGAGANSRNLSQTFEIADNFDFTPFKDHQMRVGLLLEGGTYEYFDGSNIAGRTTFASLEDFNANRPLQFSQRLDTVQTSFSQYQAGFYIQDDIRVNNRLSLGIGLRNELQSHVNDYMNLMPRIGFSLNPGGDRTSIRGGYGIYYDWYDSGLYDQTLRLNGQLQREVQIFYAYDELGNQISNEAAAPRLNKVVASPDLELPYVHQASIGVQRQLAESLSLQVTYQRLMGRNQLRARDINYGFLTEQDGQLIRVRPDAQFGTITQIESTGKSVNDRVSFQLRQQIRTASGQQIGFLNASYTLGESKANFNGATSLPVNSDDPDFEWGPQGQDVRHQFQFSGNVRLPYDFRLQGNLQVRSAPAYNLTTGRDFNLDGVIDRPEGITRNSLRGESMWHLSQLGINKSFGFGGTREGTGGGGGGRGGFTPGGGGRSNAAQGGFQGGGGRGNWGGNANNARYQIQFSVQAQNPLNRVVRTGWTGNMLSRDFMQATGIQRPRQISFNTSFRF